MKKWVFFLTICGYFFYSTDTYAQGLGTAHGLNYCMYCNLEDGWYNAVIEYSNSYNYTKSTYNLKVKVKSDKVSEIDFGNGGSVHDGSNTSGYYYNGGRLEFFTDYEGNITKAETKVTVNEGSKYRYFNIIIQ